MITVLAFAVTLLVAVLLSGLAQRSVLSTAAIFLAAGLVCGEGVLGLVSLDPRSPVVEWFTRLAMFSVLFAEGMEVRVRELVTRWHLPARALLLGMPLTLAVIALLARWTTGLSWQECLLLGAALSPTDPVFASALIGHEEVPRRLRNLLNVESGLNDGLALPLVVTFLALAGPQEAHAGELLGQVALGIALGVAIPWVALRLERSRFFSAAELYQPLNAFAIGLLVLSISLLTHANEFLAAFSAGITVAAAGPRTRERFEEFGELLGELLKLAGLLTFGALISPRLLFEMPASGYLFAGLVLLASRPAALAVAFLGVRLPWREWLAAAWFGPKGFSSVFFALLILKSGGEQAGRLFHLLALVITASIVLHSSTDVLVARWFERGEEEEEEGQDEQSP